FKDSLSLAYDCIVDYVSKNNNIIGFPIEKVGLDEQNQKIIIISPGDIIVEDKPLLLFPDIENLPSFVCKIEIIESELIIKTELSVHSENIYEEISKAILSIIINSFHNKKPDFLTNEMIEQIKKNASLKSINEIKLREMYENLNLSNSAKESREIKSNILEIENELDLLDVDIENFKRFSHIYKIYEMEYQRLKK
ncbi:MAG: hypothetical protein JXR58_10460, partial [Bacteroidales bacterium]|nr:hypothetical protein [Bacteroidales bacterium]